MDTRYLDSSHVGKYETTSSYTKGLSRVFNMYWTETYMADYGAFSTWDVDLRHVDHPDRVRMYAVLKITQDVA